MLFDVFLMLLSVFSTITALITETIKKIAGEKLNIPYNVVAMIVAMIVGVVGCGIYYKLNEIPLTTNNAIYMMLMSFSSGLASMVGFDKVKQTVEQFICLTGKG